MKNKIKNYKFGLIAEKIARIFLAMKLYNVIHHRYRNNFGEIDLIAIKGKSLIFIEVKARNNDYSEVIRKRQIYRITRSAELFISKNKKYTNYDIRFDLIIIRPWRIPIHLKSAW